MIKKIIKNIVPDTVINKYKLKKLNSKKNKTYEQMEKEINKKYKEIFGKNINWEKPVSYNEKINVSKLYCANEVKTRLTDKYEVREWIKEKIGEEYLIPLIGVYNNFEEIDFDKLPEKFVIKCNHDSNSVTLCADKKQLNIDELKNKYDFYMKRNYAYVGYEMQYKDIKPKIVIEKYIGNNINDYKFLCFNGKPYYCSVDIDRFINHKRNIYDLDWNLQPFTHTFKNYEGKIEKPLHFDKMKEIVEELCKGFDQVRVDLYEVDGKIYFGEMTFTWADGMDLIMPTSWDDKIGELWDLKFDRKNAKRS